MTIWYDLTPNLHDGTLNGSVLNEDNFIKSIFFDGVNDYVEINPAPNTSVANTFTYEFWCTANASHEIDTQSSTGFAGNTGQKYIVHPAANPTSDAADIGISIGTNGVSVYEYIPGVSGNIFDTRTVLTSQPKTGVVAVGGVFSWSEFMNNNAIWKTGQVPGNFDETYTFTVPVTGNYTISASVDNIGNVQIDSGNVLVAGGFNTTPSTYTENLTSGSHNIRLRGTDFGTVGGIAVTIFGNQSLHFPPLLVKSTTISNSIFTHVVVVVENKQPKLYIDGVLVHTGLASQKFRIYAQTQRLGGGSFGYFAGKIAVFKLYECALSASQILQRYNNDRPRFPGPPTYAISPSSVTVSEGSSVTYTVTTTNIPNGTTLYWTNSGTTVSSDFSDNSSNGSVVINNNTGTITRTLSSDASSEGTETIILELRTGSISGTIVATATTVNVTDSSITYSIVPSATTISEGASVTYTVTTTNVPNGTTLYWTNSGTTNSSDFTDNNNSGSVVINANTGTITRTTSSGGSTEGSETIILELRTGSTSGTIVATATTVNVNEEIILNNFDYAVIRYTWTNANGVDLDTRTSLRYTGTVYDNDDVGWSRGNTVGPNPYYLIWGDDNTETGSEAVLIDFKQIANDFTSLEQIVVQLNSFWYDVRNDGNVTLEFETYLGGTMSQSGFDFINTGGSVVNNLQTTVNVLTQESSNVDGECVGLLVYNVATKTATLESCLLANTIISDNFTGTALTDMSSHTPDVAGGTWLDFILGENTGFYEGYSFCLDGSGNVVPTENYYNSSEYGALYSPTTSNSSIFTIEADLQIIQPMQAYSIIYFLFKGVPVLGGFLEFYDRFSMMELHINQDGSIPYVGLGFKSDEGNQIYNLSFEPPGPVSVSVGSHKIKLVVNNLYMSVYYDDVLIAQREAASLSLSNHFGFTMKITDDLGRLGLSNFVVKEIVV